jgi:hypothetical protein
MEKEFKQQDRIREVFLMQGVQGVFTPMLKEYPGGLQLFYEALINTNNQQMNEPVRLSR